MAAFTDFFENKLIDFIFRGQSLGITTSTLYVGLLTTASGDGGPGTEVSTAGTGYQRAAVSSSLANWAATQGGATASTGSTGTTSNSNTISFPAPTDTWGSVAHFGIYDAQTGGNLLIYGALGTAKTINTGDTVTFSAGALTVQVDN